MPDDSITPDRIRHIRDSIRAVREDIATFGDENPDGYSAAVAWENIYIMAETVLSWMVGDEEKMPMPTIYVDYLKAKIEAGAEPPSYF
jgi:hypothetical protein